MFYFINYCPYYQKKKFRFSVPVPRSQSVGLGFLGSSLTVHMTWMQSAEY